MTIAHERLDDDANLKLVGLLEAGDPKGVQLESCRRGLP